MDYLLVQILVCLLIAGLIGLIIGWLIRGGCKNKLLQNDELWDTKLGIAKIDYQDKMQSLVDEQKANLNEVDKKSSQLLESELLSKESMNKELNSKLIENNMQWSQKLTKVQEQLSNERYNNKSLDISLSSAKSKVKLIESKIQHLVSENDGNLDIANQKFIQLEEDFKSEKNSSIQIDGEVKALKNEITNLKDKFSQNNIEWEQKIKNLMKDSEIRKSSATRKLLAVEKELESASKKLATNDNEWRQKLENLLK